MIDLVTKLLSEATMESSKAKESSFSLSYPMLTKTNYTAWALKMRVFMQALGVWEAIEPKDAKAVVEEKVDKRALAVIYQGIPEEMLLSIAEKKTAKDAWVAIKTLCLGADKVRTAKAQTLKSEFESLNMGETEQLDEFYLKLNALVTNIRALGETLEETYVVKKMLRAVPSIFLQIASAIEQFGKLEEMSVEEVIGSLKAHEERLRGQTETSQGKLLLKAAEWKKKENNDEQLLLTREEWLKKTSREGTRGIGDSRGKEGNRAGRDRSKVRCFNCQAYGHYASECRKPRDIHKEVNLAKSYEDEPALLMAEVGDTMLLKEEAVVPKLRTNSEGQRESQVWYLDNGASNHMTGQRGKFKKLDERVTGKVKFGDGSTVNIRGKGIVSFRCKNGEEKILKEVYYIPTLCNNIISLGQLSEDGNKVILNGDYLWVYDEQGRLLMKVKKSENRLYKISLEDGVSLCLLNKASEETTWLWHSRLGHVNFHAMNLLSTKELATGIPRFVQPKKTCKGCLMSKQTRRPFPDKANFMAKTKLELVHADLCGPISPPTSAGNRYFMLLVDDFSRVMWAYMLKTKDEALEVFRKFRALVEKGTENRVKALRTDRGGEFCSNRFKAYCEDAGIQRHYTAPYTPQQNGVVERRNRTVVSMARSLLKEMHMPSFFWGEAVRHAVYILNRLPTKILTGMTPYKAWSGKTPNLDHIRIFGCLAFMKVPSIHTQKLDDRSLPIIYLGKEPGTKACRLYSPSERQVYVSRDVVFQESEGWNWDQGQQFDCSETDRGLSVFTVDGFGLNEESDCEIEAAPMIPVRSTQSQNMTQTQSVTPAVGSTGSSSGISSDSMSAESGERTEPKHFRLLSDVYNDTEEIELIDELMFLGIDEPTTYRKAVKEKAWNEAMKNEIEVIERNKTWELSDLPKGHKAIGLKWVFKLKRNTNGDILKHKARLVAKGCSKTRCGF